MAEKYLGGMINQEHVGKFVGFHLGGYVKFFGDRNVFSESEQQEVINKYNEEDRKKLFILKPLYQRSIIVAAGPLANFVLAISDFCNN